MSYTKFHEDWEDFPSQATPINAAALEHIEDGIASAASAAAAGGNVFIQSTAPVSALDQYLWIETSADEGDVVTLWVET